MREIILDTETTGLDPETNHRVVEIGAIEMINKFVTGRKFHTYINPQRDMPTEAYRIHGISEAFLKNKPLFADIVDDFLSFIGDSVLVIHNAPFDIKFLNHELSLVNRGKLDILNTIDTLLLARQMFSGNRNSLDALCKMFKIDNSARQLHGALLDASLLAEVYIELTGGRQSKLFDEGQVQELNKSHERKRVARTFATVAPSDAELKMHEQFIAKEVKKS
ncbi:DNA polymerase III subunit epsilon [Rickettsiales endosymbiont of Paramecium tredecaurelia]|uniref:DNA polymerase III subunit epsilon n=1 Tax=Candidatus Sarmatiella mevalonica TaxID=2770581 RepID=UPI001925045B|nr:DNA polymerase III subunit epsilon [Candidatus Sarmatiella mevalonica]MBL3284424.1 DNA polymerase III subunit epsilon [Candidatus Sarmatiella mevalonica]